MLQLVPPSPVAFCAAWHCHFGTDPVHGARCCWCEREVAAPEHARGKTVACIYCGMDRGLVPIQEIEP